MIKYYSNFNEIQTKASEWVRITLIYSSLYMYNSYPRQKPMGFVTRVGIDPKPVDLRHFALATRPYVCYYALAAWFKLSKRFWFLAYN